MLTREQQFFLQILSDYLNGRKTVKQEGLDWEKLTVLSKQQELGGVLYNQTEAFLDSLPEAAEARKALKHTYDISNFVYFRQQLLFSELEMSFRENDLPFLMLKGVLLAECYPCPMLRTMSDYDLLIHSEDVDRTGKLLESCGYAAVDSSSHEWTYEKKGLTIELHDSLLHDQFINDAMNPNSTAERQFSDEIWEHTVQKDDGRLTLDDTYHFIYLLMHLKAHFISSGIGFRHFMDLFIAVKKWKPDFQTAEKELSRLGLSDFAGVCLGLCSSWFGAELPLGKTVGEDFSEETAQKLFNGGVFGFADETYKKKEALVQQHLRLEKEQASKWGIVLSRFFPSYDYLVMGEHNKFLKGRKWLLPAAWGYRFYRGLTNQAGQDLKNYVSNSFLSEEEIQENEKNMKKWGL